MKNKITLPVLSAAAVILMILVLFLTGSGGGPDARGQKPEKASAPSEKTYTLDELKEDFRRLRSVVERKYPMFFAAEEEIDKIFDRRYALLEEGMSELDFYRLLSPAVAALKCGHSNVLLSRAYESYIKQEVSLLPLEVTIIERGLYVVESKGTERIPVGSEILSINGLSSREMLETIYSSVSSDGGNRTRISEIIDNQFSFLYHTLIDESETFAVRYRLPDSSDEPVDDPAEIRSGTLRGLSFSELWGENHGIVSIGVLLDMVEIKTDYAARVLDEYATLSVGSFILGQRDFSSFLEDFFLELEEKSIEKLVIDLRGNWGGTPKPAALLLAYLSSEPVRYFDSDAPFYMFNYKRLRKPKEHAFAGTVYVLMDGSGFSTTAHFISLLKHHGIATLIGEETGGSASCSDGKRMIVLPNTGLRGYYSTRVFTTAVEGFTPGRGIEPDYRIKPAVEDIVAGRDPVAEFAATLAGS